LKAKFLLQCLVPQLIQANLLHLLPQEQEPV
jgi:hypothetical protein